MLIVCPSCTTAYRIELSTLGASGRSVRCARCRNVWFESVTEGPSTALVTVPPSGTGRPPEPATAYGDDADIAVADPPVDRADAARDASAEVAIEDAPSLVPSPTPAPSVDLAAAGAGPDIETLAARRARAKARSRRGRAWRMPGLPAIILILVAALAALVNWRTTVVRYLPQTGSLFSAVGLPVNVRGLSFDSVKTSVETREGVSVLAVEGTIVNVAREPVEVPRLRFAVRNGGGYEVYAWTAVPSQPVLAPGDAAPFRSRLASPPADGEQVIVRFFNRRDAISDVR